MKQSNENGRSWTYLEIMILDAEFRHTGTGAAVSEQKMNQFVENIRQRLLWVSSVRTTEEIREMIEHLKEYSGRIFRNHEDIDLLQPELACLPNKVKDRIEEIVERTVKALHEDDDLLYEDDEEE